MKIIARLLFGVVIFSHSYLMSMHSDIWHAEYAKRTNLILPFVEKVEHIKDKHFSNRNEGKQRKLYDFAQDIIQLASSDAAYQEALVSEPMCQHIVDSLAHRLAEDKDPQSDYYIADYLAQYMPQYKTIREGIENAFNPDGAIQNSWYANATKYVPVKYRLSGSYGHNGGVMTPLSFAIKTANYERCNKLITAGATVNRKYPDVDGNLMTALCEALILKEDKEGWGLDEIYHNIVKLLLANKADINGGYEYARGVCISPLDLAISHKDKESIFVLLIQGICSKNLVVSEENARMLNILYLCSSQESKS